MPKSFRLQLATGSPLYFPRRRWQPGPDAPQQANSGLKGGDTRERCSITFLKASPVRPPNPNPLLLLLRIQQGPLPERARAGSPGNAVMERRLPWGRHSLRPSDGEGEAEPVQFVLVETCTETGRAGREALLGSGRGGEMLRRAGAAPYPQRPRVQLSPPAQNHSTSTPHELQGKQRPGGTEGASRGSSLRPGQSEVRQQGSLRCGRRELGPR